MHQHLNKNLNISNKDSNKIIRYYSDWTQELISQSKNNFQTINKDYSKLNKELNAINFQIKIVFLNYLQKLMQLLKLALKTV